MSTILLVDDDSSLLAALEAVVQQAGFTVVTAQTGADALAAVHDAPPDAIVSDNMMPVMSGVELWRTLAAHPVYSRIPFLLQSAGSTFPEDIRPTAFLRKPFSPSRLLVLLEVWTGP